MQYILTKAYLIFLNSSELNQAIEVDLQLRAELISKTVLFLGRSGINSNESFVLTVTSTLVTLLNSSSLFGVILIMYRSLGPAFGIFITTDLKTFVCNKIFCLCFIILTSTDPPHGTTFIRKFEDFVFDGTLKLKTARPPKSDNLPMDDFSSDKTIDLVLLNQVLVDPRIKEKLFNCV